MLDISKLIDKTQELIEDPHGRIEGAAMGMIPIQEIEIKGEMYTLFIRAERLIKKQS